MKNIAIIGECMIELNGEPFGNMTQTYGGDTLNTATYLARISDADTVRVNYLTAVGHDALSQGIVARWRADGIDTRHVLIDANRHMGVYLIQLDAKGERTFLYWRNDSAARYLLQHNGWQHIDLSVFDMVYLSGISLAILPPNDREKLIEQIGAFTQSGGIVAFDSNYRPALWQSRDETRDCYRALLPHVHLALMTLDDEQALWGDDTIEGNIARLRSTGVREIVLKCGGDGVVYAHKDCRINCPAESVKVIDTTAAGDAFNAGFLHGYLKGLSSKKSCQQGNQLAGIIIQHKGAIIPKEALKNVYFKTPLPT